ncbi:MAG: sugar phosphate isomerase/epimerase, partial [Phycisphaerae bacterium]|nr:sugar phosphate isomerase/epimerase [Phycisphaerae bacterium]
VERLLQTVAHENFGLTLDTGNFLCVNADPVRAVRRLARYAQMVHVKDFHVRAKRRMPPTGWFATPAGIALRGAIVGHGVIDIPAQLRHLRSAGYDGWLSPEFEGLEEPILGIRLGLEYLRTLL